VRDFLVVYGVLYGASVAASGPSYCRDSGACVLPMSVVRLRVVPMARSTRLRAVVSARRFREGLGGHCERRDHSLVWVVVGVCAFGGRSGCRLIANQAALYVQRPWKEIGEASGLLRIGQLRRRDLCPRRHHRSIFNGRFGVTMPVAMAGEIAARRGVWSSCRRAGRSIAVREACRQRVR